MKTIHHINIRTLKTCISENNRGVRFMLSGLKKSINIVLFLISILLAELGFAQIVSTNYAIQTGILGTTYSWIDCSSGSSIVSGDDAQATISWPFDFAFYDNTYTAANSLSVCSNGFIRLDGLANTSYSAASSYNLTSTATELGQIIAMAVYDCKVGDNGGWVRSLVTGSSPNRIFTIEYNNLEIDYNDGRYTDVQVSFYETSYKLVLKLGSDNINKGGVDMGIHSGSDSYFDKWQEVYSGTNNTWIEYSPIAPPDPPSPPAASWNYGFSNGTLGTTYSWIDCSSGSFVVSGDDAQAQINWPFEFNFYDNTYTTSNALSVCTNGFIRLDGVANTDYTEAEVYDLTSTATNLGQMIAMAVYDGNVSGTGWVRSLVTGTAPDRVFTIEYNNLEINYNDGLFADVQVSFYESINKIVLKLGTDNINKSGVDMGLHSGVDTYFHKWQEVLSGTNNTWIEYTPPNIEVNATTGISTAYYPTLKDAFDKINDGIHQGNITIKINHSTTEITSAILNSSGAGSANYSSINMYPTETGISINGNLSAPLIDLNGADNVSIDGRVNGTGASKDLSIINTSTGSVSGTSAIRFINDASNNTVKYCTIKNSESRSTSGIVFFSSTTSSSGNDNNVIENNDITTAANANRPVNAIYSLGTNGKENSGNIIRDNNIYDFFKHASASRGILLANNTTEWTIDGNSFYETTSYIGTGTVTYDAIKIDNISGNGFTISNNFFGGTAAECGGTAWTKTNATNNVFNAIYLKVGTTLASSVQNNTIQNFNWSNSANASWTGINIYDGSVNIGTLNGNTIGASTGTNSISVVGGSNGLSIYGIRLESTGEINCNNNNIGAITGTTLSTLSTHIYGIRLYGSATVSISNNNIGSTNTSSSINASSASTANVQKVYGIYSSSSGITTVHQNTILNLRNNTSNAAVGTSGLINGIYLTSGTNTVDENTIRNLSIANASTSTYSPSIAGIHLNTTTEAQSIHQNLIYNISNTYASFTGCVVGIYTRNSVGASAGNINANFIHSLSVDAASTGANIYGIYENTDGIVYSNNIITLGGSTSTAVSGMYDVGNSGKSVDIFFNTIYVSGTNSGSEKSYAIRYNTNSNTRDLRNNVFSNARSGGTGGHYAIYYDATGGTFTADYNDYYVSGTGGVLGYFGGNQSTLALLKTATSQDANSLNTDPSFISAGGTNDDDYVTLASLPGVTGTGITTTYHGITRTNPPKMGALEVSPTFIWQGNTSTDFATATNWQDGAVPPNGADLEFAATPANDCYLDQNRTLHDITNTSTKKFYINGQQFTLSGDIDSNTTNQIDATTASSVLIFAGSATQNIPTGVFVSNTVDALILDNDHGLSQNGNLIIPNTLTLTDGVYNIGANTLTINGAISTASGSLLGGSTSNIFIGGSGANTILPGVSLNNLTLNRANGISLGGSLSIEGTLTLTTGTLTLGSDTLSILGSSPSRTSGNIDASNTSATVVLGVPSAITLATSLFAGSLNNLTINGLGITAVEDLTVNGILDIQSANPSALKGCLDMGANTLLMGATATNIGIGDVTGKVKRNTILANIEYTFGHQHTSVIFPAIGTLPTEITLKISIGVVPSWKADAIKRVYDISQDGGSGTKATMKSHYLDSELNGNEEINLSFFSYIFPSTTLLDRGLSDLNTDENWIALNNADFGNLPPILGVIEHGFGVSTSNVITWDGSESTDWYDPYNWTPAYSPDSTKKIVIPDASTTLYDPIILDNTSDTISTLSIQVGGILTAGSNTQISIKGSSGAWINEGIFNAVTGKVLFNHGVLDEVVTIAGNTNFYDIEVGANTTIQPVSGNILRIAGAVSADVTSVVDFTTINSTVEWNGGDQTIVNPNGIGGNSGYYKLILSGSGTKTMPTTAMNIVDELKISGTAIATAQAPLAIGVELEILEDATFATGNFDHTVGGPFDNRGTFIASSGTNITLNGTVIQEIYGDSPTTFEKLTIDNAAGVDIITEITVNDTLTLTSGNLNVGATTITINGAITKTSGFINTTTQSSLTFGGTTALMTTVNLFASTPDINNLTINRTGGVELCCDFTVNGIVNLQSANPSAIKGTLDMGTNTLLMGATATNIGIGDLIGKVKRTTILVNTEYTFGHPNSSVIFPAIGTLPTEITLKISIGVVPSWKSDAIQRVVDISQIGGSGTRGVIKAHYLDSELNGNEEVNISYFSYIIPSTTLLDRGRTEINTTENWITLNNADFGNLPSAFGVIEHGFGVSTSNVITWDGSESTDWFDQYNWTPAFSPDSTKIVIIPDASTTPRDPVMAAATADTVFNLTIQAGGILSAGAGTQLTIKGSSGAWSCYGTFNAGTGKVLFNHGVLSNIVTVAGTTNFYDIEVGANTTMQSVSGCILRIEGSGSADMTNSKVDFSTINNTVEFNGINQTIVYPFGIDINNGFYNLILSGSGTKTMPDTTVIVSGDFTISGTASAIAADSMIVRGNTTIANGATFATGSHHHFLSGNFENNGTFTPTSGGTVSFNGTITQTISGSSAISYDNITIDNEEGITLESDININNLLTFNHGNLSVGVNTLGINGTVNNLSGNIEVSNTSSLSFGGTSAITLNDNLFNGDPSINNLIINRSGGVALGNESFTVSGNLALTSGTLTLAANTLTLAANAPTLTSGNIDASHTSANLVFENPAAIILPASLFSGNVNNMTISGAGGITASSDFTIDGILNLQSANPSSVKGSLDMNGYTLNMGTASTTIGQGDVSGIIRRTSIVSHTSYTMGNQYTTIYFPNVGTLPTEISLKVSFGSTPSWRTGAIERVYDFIQTGGSGTEAVLQGHYLDSELNSNNKDKLVQWLHIYAYPLTIEYGRSDYNTNENWVAISHVNVAAFSSIFGEKEIVFDEYELLDLTWNGSTSTSWVTATNWTPQGAPSDETVVTIPDAATTTFDPSIPALGICGKVIIESGGILNSVSDGQLTVMGANGAWDNSGTFAPGTGTVIFANGDETETVTISGTNSFNNLTVRDKTKIQPTTNTVTNIAGEFTANPNNCILDFSSNPNTVAYNGRKVQSVVNPGGVYGYYHLSFSDSGLIILPESSLKILGNLSINASISANGNTLLMAGTLAQNMSGDTATILNNITIDNASGVTLTNTAITTISGSLLINSGNKFEIAAGKNLSVTGTITNNAGNSGFILNSDATGTASLIHNSDNVAATVELFVSGVSEDWHFISSPLTGQGISGSWLPSGTYGNGTGYDMYLWNESNSCWIYQLNTSSIINWNTVHPGSNFEEGRGYLYSVQETSPTKEFIGNLNNGTTNISLSYASDTLSLKGFNLIGNPYPTSIDWKASSGWTRTNLASSGGGNNMWIWNPAANNYGVYNSADIDDTGTNSVGRYIASSQGFFVQASNTGNLSMTNSVRILGSANNWFKNVRMDDQKLSVCIKSNEGLGFDEVELNFGYADNEKGALKLFSPVVNAPSLYIPYSSEDLSVLNLTDTEENPVIPINFIAGANGSYTINCDFDINNFDIVMLEDCKTHDIQDMKTKQTYHFIAEKSENENRFKLHFGAIDGDFGEELPARIYSVGSHLMIDLLLVTNETTITVFDIMGRQILKGNYDGETQHNIPFNTNTQIIIVHLENPNGSITKKVLLNKY